MANIVITPSLVIPSAAALSSAIRKGISGATIEAGDAVYIDRDDSKKIKLAESGDTAAKAAVEGLALTGSSPGQPVQYVIADVDLDLGVTVGGGVTVVLSATPGAMCPDEDIVAGRKVVLGVGKGGTKINFKPVVGGSL